MLNVVLTDVEERRVIRFYEKNEILWNRSMKVHKRLSRERELYKILIQRLDNKYTQSQIKSWFQQMKKTFLKNYDVVTNYSEEKTYNVLEFLHYGKLKFLLKDTSLGITLASSDQPNQNGENDQNQENNNSKIRDLSVLDGIKDDDGNVLTDTTDAIIQYLKVQFRTMEPRKRLLFFVKIMDVIGEYQPDSDDEE